MPYLTSGLLAFKKPTAKVVLELGEWIREHSSPSVTYLVQLDGGRALAMAVEARVGSERQNGDVSHFVNARVLGAFAKHFKRPFWGGFAEGGYSNSQSALAVDAKGKARWRSSWRFEYPAKVEERGLYPLATPDDNAALYAAERAKKGYGRIGEELGADFYELLSIERGDPLAKVPFLELTARTTERALAKWLATYRPLKREPTPPVPDEAYLVMDGNPEKAQERMALVTMLVALACRDRKLRLPQFMAFGSADALTCAFRGPAVDRLSAIMLRQPFLDFLSEKLAAPVRVVSVRKEKVVASNGRVDPMTQLRGGPQLVVPDPKEWTPFPELPTDVFGQLEKLLRSWARAKSREAAAPQVILRTGLGLLG